MRRVIVRTLNLNLAVLNTVRLRLCCSAAPNSPVIRRKSLGRSLPFKECHCYVNRNSVTAIWAPLPYTFWRIRGSIHGRLTKGMIKYSPYLGILQRTKCPFPYSKDVFIHVQRLSFARSICHIRDVSKHFPECSVSQGQGQRYGRKLAAQSASDLRSEAEN